MHPQEPPLIGAVVVLFFPDEDLIRRLLSGLKGEVGKIYIVDNTPKGSVNWPSIEWFLTNHYDVTYQSFEDNYGVAKAQNVGIELALNGGCNHVILFDQDSAIPKGMVKNLLSAEQDLIAQGLPVGVVGPIFVDEKTGKYSNIFSHNRFFIKRVNVSPSNSKPINADYVIASGSLIRADVLKSVGLMREHLFIDWVDIEWCLRANKLGFLHFAIPTATMLHSIGDGTVSLGFRSIHLHSDLRHYYIVRNACHLILDSQIDRKWRINMLVKIPLWVVFFSLTSKSKPSAFKLLLRACVDGFSGRLGKLAA